MNELLTPITEYVNYVYHNNKVYLSSKAAAKTLEMGFKNFEVALSYAKGTKPLAHRDWFLCLLKTRIKKDRFYYYDQKVLIDFKYHKWECEDFIFKVLNALDEILENKILTVDEINQICEINNKALLVQYVTSQKIMGFNQALKIYTKLKEYQNDLQKLPKLKAS